jgi:hypothetical protein
MYVFLALKFKNTQMKSKEMGVTEECFYYRGSFDMRHNCGRVRTFLEHTE